MRRFTLLIAGLVLAAFALAPAASAARPQGALDLPVSGTVVGGTLTDATFELQRFVSQGGQLLAVGTLSGTLTNSLGVAQEFSQQVRLPVTAINATCDILHLELGPLDLDLLGLQVHLDRIVLDITAESGPGNLLGNLLCAVAGLLDGQGALNSIAQLLNQILALLS